MCKIILVVLVFIAVDVIVGVVKGVCTVGFKSMKMRVGLFHKLGEILAVGFGYLCEYSFPYVGINISIPVVSTICIYIVLMETGSIVENLSEISPNIKKVLGKVFEGYKQDSEE